MDVSSYLKLPEVALRLGVSEKTARRYIKSGALSSIFVGNAYRVHPDELTAFVERESIGHSVVEESKAPKGQASLPSEDAKQRRSSEEMEELLEQVGAATRYLALPRDEFEALWEGKTVDELQRLNQELFEEGQLVRPLLARWTAMPFSEERAHLHDLWMQHYFIRLWITASKNEAAATAAVQEGNKAVAEKLGRLANESLKRASNAA